MTKQTVGSGKIPHLKIGDAIVIHGSTEEKRDVVKYTDAKSLVEYFRSKDDPDNEYKNNEEYMHSVTKKLQEVYEVSVLPCHNEEAFVGALFRLKLCSVTVLN